MDQKKSRRRRKRKTEEKVDFNIEYPPLTPTPLSSSRPILSYSSVAKNIPLPMTPVTLDDLARLGEAEMKSWS